MTECSAYVGLDVHKDTIAVAVARPGREEPVYRGEIKNQRKALLRLIRSLSPHAEVLSFLLRGGSVRVWGVSRDHRRRPLLRGGSAEPDPAVLGGASEDGSERRGEAGAAASVGGTDRGVGARRGARGDARPDAGARGHEGDRGQGSAATGAFLLRHDRVYREGKSRWTQRHFRWLEEQRFEHPVQQVVFQ